MEVDDASDQTSDGMYDHLQMLLFVCLVMFCAFFCCLLTFFQIILKKNVLGTFFLFCFVALRPKSTAMVIAGRSVHLTTLFPGQA